MAYPVHDAVRLVAVLRLLQTGVVDKGVLERVVRAGRAKVHTFLVDLGHLDTVDDDVLRTIEHDAFLRPANRQPGEPPVCRTVEVQPVATVVGQHRIGRSGECDRRLGGAFGGGDEVSVIGATSRIVSPGSAEARALANSPVDDTGIVSDGEGAAA